MRVLVSLVLALVVSTAPSTGHSDENDFVPIRDDLDLASAIAKAVSGNPDSTLSLILQTGASMNPNSVGPGGRGPKFRFHYGRVGRLVYERDTGRMFLRTPEGTVVEQILDRLGGEESGFDMIHFATVVPTGSSVTNYEIRFVPDVTFSMRDDSEILIVDLTELERTEGWHERIGQSFGQFTETPRNTVHVRLLEQVFSAVSTQVEDILPRMSVQQLASVQTALETQFWQAAAEVPLEMTEEETRAFIYERQTLLQTFTEMLNAGGPAALDRGLAEKGLRMVMQIWVASELAGLTEYGLDAADSARKGMLALPTVLVSLFGILTTYSHAHDPDIKSAIIGALAGIVSAVLAYTSESGNMRSALQPTHGPYGVEIKPIRDFLGAAQSHLRKLLGCETVLETSLPPGPSEINWTLPVMGF